jgi:hypothetical protein
MFKNARWAVVPMLGALVFFGFGCNPFQKAQDSINQKIGEKVTEGILEKATGGKVDVKKDGEQVTFKDNKTGAVSAFGEDVKLPDGFPKSLPMYPGAKISGVTMTQEKEQSAWVMFSAGDEVKKVVDWYAQQTKDAGWKEDSSMTLGTMETRSYTKGNEKISLNASVNEDATKGKTTAILTWNIKQEAPAADGGNQ